MQIYQSVEISCFMEFIEEERFGSKALFKTVLDFLFKEKNVRISYVYETHHAYIDRIIKYLNTTRLH